MRNRKSKLNFRIMAALAIMAALVMIPMGSVLAQKPAAYTLVDSGKICTMDLTGQYREYSPETGYVYYPAEGRFTTTLSPVATNDVIFKDGALSFAAWENWKPLIKGTVIVHKPEGDISFNVSWRGTGQYDWGRLTFESVIGVHETGPAFNEATMSFSELTSEGKLPEEGPAYVRLYSDDGTRRSISLSGDYTTDDPTAMGGIKQGSQPANDYLKAKGTLPTFKMVDSSMKVTATLTGVYQVGGWGGEAYPAEATLIANIKPVPADTVAYYESPWGAEYDAWWDNNPVSFQGTVRIYGPEETVEFDVSGSGTPVSGYDAYRDQNGLWYNGIPAALTAPLHEKGRDSVDFYGDPGGGGDALLDLYCVNPYGPQMAGEGEAGLRLSGIDGILRLSGFYQEIR